MAGEGPGGSVKCSQEEHVPWVRNLGQCFPSFSLGHLLHAAGMVRMQRWEQRQPQAQGLEEGWSLGHPVVLNLTLWPLLRAACSCEKQQSRQRNNNRHMTKMSANSVSDHGAM